MQAQRWAWWLACGAAVVSLALVGGALAQGETPPPKREAAEKLMRDGNWKEAYDAWRKILLTPAADAQTVPTDLNQALQCLQNLGRWSEIDAFRESAIAVHKGNWRLLFQAAQSYLNIDHQGCIVAGQFERGPHRGGTARYVNSYERDRVRALQLMEQAAAAAAAAGETNAGELGSFHFQFAAMILSNRGWDEAWRLQYLTDLKTLPDYEDGYYYWRGGQNRGAPVDEAGNPILHQLPKSWEAAQTDGERWRWCLLQAAELNPGMAPSVKWHFAQFLYQQFGEQTLAEYGWFFGRTPEDDDTRKDESGVYALHTLKEEETIARLATGIRRFTLPDEFNFMKMFRALAEAKSCGDGPRQTLAQVFENRRQYPQAAEEWRRAIAEFGEGHDAWRRKRLEQITGNWGMFEPVLTQPAGTAGASVEYRFRNGKKVSLKAYAIDVPKLLGDVKAYLKSNPRQLEWERLEINQIGYRLVEKNQSQYIGEKVADWDLELKPRPGHWDRRLTVETPLKKAGAYLLVGEMAGGNTSRVILWVADTAIVKKPLDNAPYYFVCEALTGRPVPGAALEFFGYRQDWVQNKVTPGGRHEVYTRTISATTDADGQYFQKLEDDVRRYNWIVTATTPEGRLAYLGFSGIWWNNYHDQEYNATKVYAITDRPVYRPEQPVKFKFWVNHAKYDQEGDSAFAGQAFTVRVTDPKGEKVFEKGLTADKYGGFDGEFTLAKTATLGVYSLQIVHDGRGVGGGGTFRLEEYKKPEFEVKVEAPTEPVMLGEKITAKVQAKYYFGAPVSEAKVKYKVQRTSFTAGWYPVGYWDWFYGAGYWWYAYDYVWYPGWREWGCWRPRPWWWWNWHPQQPPEIVAEGEAPIGKDGTLSVTIDSAVAKAIHPDSDHRYEITAEVTDLSRRVIVGQGTVLVARKPFKVYAWVDRGHYRSGDVVEAAFTAQTLDNKPVKGKGRLRLLKIDYKDNAPVEKVVEKWDLDTDEQGCARLQIKAAEAGQYRLSYEVTDAQKHAIEGGYVFCVYGEGYAGSDFRFNDVELVPDKKEYAPGQKVKLAVNTNRRNGTVLLFVRPANGVYLPPKVLRLKGRSAVEEIEVLKRDMPSFYVEAVTVSDGKVFEEMKEIVVPPEKRVLDVEVTPSAPSYKPGAPAKIKVKLTDPTGEPYSGSTVLTFYDKSVEYIAGGSNVPAIRDFFWKWRRSHQMQHETSLARGCGNILKSKEIGMGFLGIFGAQLADESDGLTLEGNGGFGGRGKNEMRKSGMLGGRQLSARRAGAVMNAVPEASVAMAPGAPMAAAEGMAMDALADAGPMREQAARGEAGGGAPMVQPTVRTNFADTALWVAALQTDARGEATVDLTMPENLTTWKARVWAMGGGATCGEGSAEVVTTKNLIIRLQAPRFFVQKDEVVLSANVHNFLKEKKKAKVVLELQGGTLAPLEKGAKAVDGVFTLEQTITLEAGAEQRVDWRVQVLQPGEAVVRMKALTDEESDAMEMKFPVYVHGMLKTESFSGVIRPDQDSAKVSLRVPAERRPDQTRLELRYSPTLAGAMVDALPYMVDYPYGCTEQTLNRFLPAVITQKILLRMGLDLKEIQQKRTNLNAQEIGDDVARARQWQRYDRNPVFDLDEVQKMVQAGIDRLESMHCADGGWGWFSGYGEHSYPHTTAVVVHGLQIARDNDVALPGGMLERGIAWLKTYQADQVRRLKLPKEHREHKSRADDLDAFVYMVLVDAKQDHAEMRDFLYRDRNDLAVYTKAMFGIALHKVGDLEKRDMLIRNVEQFLVQDDENQSAWLKLPENNWWWYWYGSEYEAHAYYLKLLAVTDPKGEKAARLVKYLINNRKHATYWNSTRDTAVVIEAFADFIKASGEDAPDMTVTVLVDGKAAKDVKISRENLFTFDNKLVLEGAALADGEHTVEVRRAGKGPVYFNAYLTNFTLEDPITKAGLEIKVERAFYKLVPVDKKIKVAGSRGQAVDQKVEKYERQPLANLAELKSGDLVEVELVIESKNDYEYIVLEDMKGAGFEPVDVRSGYTGNEMGAYVEFRDERVVLFVRALARGKHSVSYRTRAEIPGRFSALPTKASAMYAPELKANSDELKLVIED